jgi:hypothetical protein
MLGTIITIVLAGFGAVAVAGALYLLIFRHRPRKALNQQYFAEQWKELQKKLSDKASWAEAITSADNLLEEALKKKRVQGKGIGERLVKVQRSLTNNDGVWFGHKLRRKLDNEPDTKLKEADVKQALVGIRQALKDLGALPDGQPRDTK